MNSGLGIGNITNHYDTVNLFSWQKGVSCPVFHCESNGINSFCKNGPKNAKNANLAKIWQNFKKKSNFSIFQNLRYKYFEAKQDYFANAFFENCYFLMPKYQFLAFKNANLRTKK